MALTFKEFAAISKIEEENHELFHSLVDSLWEEKTLDESLEISEDLEDIAKKTVAVAKTIAGAIMGKAGLGDDEKLKRFVALLKDRDSAKRIAARQGIKALAGKGHVQAQKEWKAIKAADTEKLLRQQKLNNTPAQVSPSHASAAKQGEREWIAQLSAS